MHAGPRVIGLFFQRIALESAKQHTIAGETSTKKSSSAGA
jgi:hypothetical protein